MANLFFTQRQQPPLYVDTKKKQYKNFISEKERKNVTFNLWKTAGKHFFFNVKTMLRKKRLTYFVYLNSNGDGQTAKQSKIVSFKVLKTYF